MSDTPQKITPFLWFDRNAEEAMNYYVSVFKDARIIEITRYPEGVTEGPMKDFGGQVLNGTLELFGQRFYCLDGGPVYTFNEAISFMITCQDQAEIDYYWEKLSAVPESEQCGWCKDTFGLSWQVIPANLSELISSSPAAMQKMLSMKKIDIAELEAAGNN